MVRLLYANVSPLVYSLFVIISYFGRLFGIERNYRNYISMYKNKENYRKESCAI